MKPITIVLIDDHPLFRQGVADILSLEPDFSVVGQAADGEEGLDLIRAKQPEIAVVDVNLPGINGQIVTRTSFQEKLPTRIVLLTAYDDTEQQIVAMRAGAAAYCSKDIEPERLVEIIRSVAQGGYYVGGQKLSYAEVTKWLAGQGENALRNLLENGEPLQPLSAREMEVLVLVTQGRSNKEIAHSLRISHQTVKNHVTAILRKLGVEDRTQAVLVALRRGWVRL